MAVFQFIPTMSSALLIDQLLYRTHTPSIPIPIVLMLTGLNSDQNLEKSTYVFNEKPHNHNGGHLKNNLRTSFTIERNFYNTGSKRKEYTDKSSNDARFSSL